MNIEIGFKDMRQTVALLGEKTNLNVKKNDILVFGALRVKEWQRERCLESSYLTMIEVNPNVREGLEMVNEIGQDEPKRKVMRITLPEVARVSDVVVWGEQLIQNAPTNDTRECVIVGHLSSFTMDFFEQDPPLVGAHPNEKMC